VYAAEFVLDNAFASGSAANRLGNARLKMALISSLEPLNALEKVEN
jgi:hypothetical protein